MGTAVNEPAPWSGEHGDLVVVAISGVQRFISESRTTSDLGAGSAIIGRLAGRAALECRSLGARLVFPASVEAEERSSVSAYADKGAPLPSSVPNRIVAVASPGSGSAVAAAAAEAVRGEWARLVEDVWHRPAATPGMPSVQWVCVEAAAGDYAQQWAVAQRTLVARRRLRNFDDPLDLTDRELCSLSPRWPAEPKRPPHVPAHEQDRLSAANWVKRRYRAHAKQTGAGWDTPGSMPPGFPSTSAIASAPYRQWVLLAMGSDPVGKAVTALHKAVRLLADTSREHAVPGLDFDPSHPVQKWFACSGGRWVFRETWQGDVLAREFGRVGAENLSAAVTGGLRAVSDLHRAMEQEGLAAPSPYLAVMAQDLDNMGRFLGGEPSRGRGRLPVTEERHSRVSAQLSSLAERTVRLLHGDEYFGVPVYAGGDDLLAFVPAERALAASRACRDEIPDSLPRASSAVLFFHHRSSLQHAVTEVQHLLELAKEKVPRKNGLAVGYVRRSGVREQSLQPWQRAGGGPQPVDDFSVFLDSAYDRPLSLRLVQDCLRDEEELASLPGDLFSAELARLVGRHSGTRPPTDAVARAQADALARLARGEASRQVDAERRVPRLAEPVKVAAFLRRECGGSAL
ncbi:Cas10/Cmr2 second palm domain-containing protein [Streptomyces chiangmaiensis]|uniref:Type III-B CRISPR-associated protein Cas10/Cmr2 n=1 Tax=Streptomyces chiangmaiensis TaxID=766497 RepID=A0ABU7FP16_9ACTN|nr:type III-B CRISPR-associated protein Cas10/Cmr2 [Streptomyces chiangmaiensis]MED7825502.1 type III-B CRISPR-associated protein Cas10/Cmr2 [Streptomyces chiangmaiensis]